MIQKFKQLRKKYRCTQRRIQWLIDLIEKNPFEIGLSLALIAFGGISAFNGIGSLPSSVSLLPFGLTVLYCALSAMGGFAVIFGLLAKVKFGWAYGWERFGLFVSASAWLSYIAGILLNPPLTGKSTMVILALSAFSISCLIRARTINKKAKATLAALRFAQDSQEKFDG